MDEMESCIKLITSDQSAASEVNAEAAAEERLVSYQELTAQKLQMEHKLQEELAKKNKLEAELHEDQLKISQLQSKLVQLSLKVRFIGVWCLRNLFGFGQKSVLWEVWKIEIKTLSLECKSLHF